MRILRATVDHVQPVAELFDLYRQFYEQPADATLAETFIRERIASGESIIFWAETPNGASGFVQLYPSFCSVEAIKILILYDLFVHPDFRRQGVAEALMKRAALYAQESGAKRVDLLTAVDNHAGQRLYEKLDYKRVPPIFVPYSLPIP